MTDNSDPDRQQLAPLLGVGSSDQLGPLPRVPALPFAVFDEFGLGADDRVQDYAAALVAAERAESARLRHLLNLARDDYNTAAQRLQDIGDFAHDRSTGPAVPDDLWEVREMAYGSGA